MLFEDSKALLTEDDSGMEQLTFLAAVPTVMSLARVPSAVRHVDVAGEALTQAVMENLGCRILHTAHRPLFTPLIASSLCYCPCGVIALCVLSRCTFVCCAARL